MKSIHQFSERKIDTTFCILDVVQSIDQIYHQEDKAHHLFQMEVT